MALPNSPSYRAGGTIIPRRCVKISADNTIVMCAAATDNAIGIAKRSMRDAPGLTGSDTAVAASSGESCEVYGPGSVAPAEAGAAITLPNWVTSDGTGRVIAAAGATTRPVGFALEAASGAGVEIQVFVHPYSATLP
jgi:hypothetical protein